MFIMLDDRDRKTITSYGACIWFTSNPVCYNLSTGDVYQGDKLIGHVFGEDRSSAPWEGTNCNSGMLCVDLRSNWQPPAPPAPPAPRPAAAVQTTDGAPGTETKCTFEGSWGTTAYDTRAAAERELAQWERDPVLHGHCQISRSG